MTPLEAYLSRREIKRADFFYHLVQASRRMPRFVGSWINKIVFPKVWKHMRFIPPELAIHPQAPGKWLLTLHGRIITETLPLEELVGKLDKPVSIVASGPSARDYPWDQLRDGSRFVIAVNGAPTLLKEYGITPDLMVVIDDKFCQSGAQHFTNAAGVPLVIETIAGAVWAKIAPDDLRGRKVTFLERVNSWYAIPRSSFSDLIRLNTSSGRPWVLPQQADPKFRVGWSHLPELGFFSGRTVTYAAVQIAVKLGAKEIEIIGMDLGGKGRAYEEKENARPSYLDEHYEKYILPSFEIMARALEGTGVKVKNLSPVCPLPAHFFAG